MQHNLFKSTISLGVWMFGGKGAMTNLATTSIGARVPSERCKSSYFVINWLWLLMNHLHISHISCIGLAFEVSKQSLFLPLSQNMDLHNLPKNPLILTWCKVPWTTHKTVQGDVTLGVVSNCKHGPQLTTLNSLSFSSSIWLQIPSAVSTHAS